MPETLKIQGKMNFHLISPKRVVLDTVADKVLLPTAQGPVMILPQRAPLFLGVSIGTLWLKNEEEMPLCYLISDGCAEIRRNICSVLAWGIPADDIPKEYLENRLVSARKELTQMNSSYGKHQLQRYMDYLSYVLSFDPRKEATVL